MIGIKCNFTHWGSVYRKQVASRHDDSWRTTNRHPSFNNDLYGLRRKKKRLRRMRRVTGRAGPITRHRESVLVSWSMLVEILINLVQERPAIFYSCDSNHWDRDVIVVQWKKSCCCVVVLRCDNSFTHFEPFVGLRTIHQSYLLWTTHYVGLLGLATQELYLGKQNILLRYHELP